MFPIRDHNPSERTPYVTYALLASNIVIFAMTVLVYTTDMALLQLYYDYALIPERLSAGENPSALVTSMFLHGGFMHLAGNMLFLWVFGDNLEDMMGHVGFALFYLACGVLAALAQYITAPYSPIPTIGASGAIAGVMGGYLLLFPKARVDILIWIIIFIRVIPIPAWITLVLWFAFQLINGAGSDPTQGGVAYWAHAGGFIAGFVLCIPIWMKKGGPKFWNRTHGHPPHPETRYVYSQTRIPQVRRRR